MVSRKGQLFSMDLVMAALILLVILVSFLALWMAGLTRLAYFESERWREEAARTAVEQVVETPGYPTHWEQLENLTETNVRSLGLARSRNVLSHEKLAKLDSLEGSQYYFLKRVLGVQRYDMQILVTDLGGSELYSFRDAPPNDKKITSVSRIALVNDTVAVVRVYVWE